MVREGEIERDRGGRKKKDRLTDIPSIKINRQSEIEI